MDGAARCWCWCARDPIPSSWSLPTLLESLSVLQPCLRVLRFACVHRWMSSSKRTRRKKNAQGNGGRRILRQLRGMSPATFLFGRNFTAHHQCAIKQKNKLRIKLTPLDVPRNDFVAKTFPNRGVLHVRVFRKPLMPFGWRGME